MIDLYTWATPNGRKVHVMLEETGLAYQAHAVDISKGEQFEPEFLRISPNNKIPAIVDDDGYDGKPYAVFESGAILIYLAEKTGRFLSPDPAARMTTFQWLMFQMGGVGPMAGQAHHFRHYAPEKLPYAIERYTKEVRRLYCVMNRRLAETEYLAGDYSIADIACYPWVRSYERQGTDIAELPHLKRWFDAIAARPAVQRAWKILDSRRVDLSKADAETRSILFGQRQFAER